MNVQTLTTLVICVWMLGSVVQSPSGWAATLPPDSRRAAQQFYRTASAESAKGRFLHSAQLLRRALELDPDNVIYVLCLGQALRNAGCYSDAAALLNAKLASFPEEADQNQIRSELGETHNRWGLSLLAQRLSSESIDHFVVSADYFSTAGEPDRAAYARSNQALAMQRTGHLEQARSLYEQLLSSNHDAPMEALISNNLGLVDLSLGRYGEAQDLLDRARVLNAATGDEAREADSLANLGATCHQLGQFSTAVKWYERALQYYRSHPDRQKVAEISNNLGHAYLYMGKPDRAIHYYRQALSMALSAGDSQDKAIALSNLALALIYEHKWSPAGKALGDARHLYSLIGDREGLGICEYEFGLINMNQGNNAEAADHLENALSILRETGSRGAEMKVLHNLMVVCDRRGADALAIAFGKQAVNVNQELRSHVTNLSKEIQRGFLSSHQNTYRTLASILIVQGRIPEAQQVLNMLKEQEYYEFVRGEENTGPLDKVYLTNREAGWLKRYDELGNRLTALGVEKHALDSKERLSDEDEKTLGKLRDDIAQATQFFNAFLGEMKNESTIPQEDVKADRIKDVQSLQHALDDIGGGSVAVHTLVGKNKMWLILTTPDVQLVREESISRDDLNRKVIEFREILRDPNLDPRPLAKELYDMVIGPIAHDLEGAQAKTITWSLDGTLRYIPIAALWDGKEYMVEKYRNVVYTPAADFWLVGKPQDHWEALGLGVTKEKTVGTATFPALDGVADELRGIIKEGSGPGLIPGTILLDQQFTFDSMQRSLRGGKYQLVHIATHFSSQPGDETKSFLLTWDDDPPNLSEFKNRGNFKGVDLLTLSACDTNFGGTGANGAEVDSLAMDVQREGAHSVIASLWSVDDESTRLLMTRFYQAREQSPDEGKAEALRQSQLSLLTGISKPTGSTRARGKRNIELVAGEAPPSAPEFKSSSSAPYAHPYYWAPFVLMGNWR